jgi:hypothetical protein
MPQFNPPSMSILLISAWAPMTRNNGRISSVQAHRKLDECGLNKSDENNHAGTAVNKLIFTRQKCLVFYKRLVVRVQRLLMTKMTVCAGVISPEMTGVTWSPNHPTLKYLPLGFPLE